MREGVQGVGSQDLPRLIGSSHEVLSALGTWAVREAPRTVPAPAGAAPTAPTGCGSWPMGAMEQTLEAGTASGASLAANVPRGCSDLADASGSSAEPEKVGSLP